jgi:hypothetical protein
MRRLCGYLDIGWWARGGQPFEPHLEIVVRATLVVVDEQARSYVHRRYKGQSSLCDFPSHLI